jgi:hypothetical protein
MAWRNGNREDLVIACKEDQHLPVHPELLTGSPDFIEAMNRHQGLHSNGVTIVAWEEGDRRNFHGEFPGWCQRTPGCVLPAGHRTDGSGCAT